jgi:hypothetical protein
MTVRFGMKPIGPLRRGAGGGRLLVSTSMGLSLSSVRAGDGGGGGVGATILFRQPSGTVTVQALGPTWNPTLTRQPNGTVEIS